ncbi:MAG: hypothetical protein KME21_12330 [Desmonostoc vinosum HA7617-LM4]|jgi:hypothetical protein|nr:hypothetical protein [Desmonostoc vinosum HA7617-LM4]
MKLSQILKLAVIPVLTTISLTSTSNTALADYLNSEGTGGDYRYQLWSSDDGNYYYLKIWSYEANPENDPNTITRAFTSTREALNYFDCNYARKNLPECSQ